MSFCFLDNSGCVHVVLDVGDAADGLGDLQVTSRNQPAANIDLSNIVIPKDSDAGADISGA